MRSAWKLAFNPGHQHHRASFLDDQVAAFGPDVQEYAVAVIFQRDLRMCEDRALLREQVEQAQRQFGRVRAMDQQLHAGSGRSQPRRAAPRDHCAGQPIGCNGRCNAKLGRMPAHRQHVVDAGANILCCDIAALQRIDCAPERVKPFSRSKPPAGRRITDLPPPNGRSARAFL